MTIALIMAKPKAGLFLSCSPFGCHWAPGVAALADIKFSSAGHCRSKVQKQRTAFHQPVPCEPLIQEIANRMSLIIHVIVFLTCT